MGAVDVYAKGPLSCSVCAPVDMTPEQVAEEVNRQECEDMAKVTGVKPLPWQIADDTHFSTGQEIPCPCESRPETHRHWLLVV